MNLNLLQKSLINTENINKLNNVNVGNKFLIFNQWTWVLNILFLNIWYLFSHRTEFLIPLASQKMTKK